MFVKKRKSNLNSKHYIMPNTPEEKDQNTKTRLALIEQSIASFTRMYTNDMAELKASLKVVLEHYVTRGEIDARFDRQQDEIDGRMEGANERIGTKLDRKDFDKFQVKVEDHINDGRINFGGVAQSVITTVLTTAILGGLYFFGIK